MTSHDVVALVRRRLQIRKVGHCGTLDPLATGLLLLTLGRGTKIQDLLMAEDKVDRASRDKIRSQKRDIPEGTEEWDLLHRRYYSEELKKLGIDLAKP